MDKVELSDDTKFEILREQVMEFRLTQAEGAYQAWGAELVQRLSPDSRIWALSRIGQLDRAVKVAVEVINDRIADASLRSSAAGVLGQIGQVRPEVVTAPVVDGILSIVTDPVADASVRDSVVFVLAQLGQVRPQVVTAPVVERLVSIVTDSTVDASVRISSGQACALLTHVSVRAVSDDMRQALISQLTQDNDKNERNAAMHCLFFLAIGNSEQAQLLLEQLKAWSSSRQPHIRMVASKTLEMVTVGGLIQEARAHPEQLPLIKARLGTLHLSVEEHVVFAARFALSEIEKIEQGMGK